MLSHFSRVRLFATLWTRVRQALLSMGFSRQEYWSGLPCPSPRDLSSSGIETSTDNFICCLSEKMEKKRTPQLPPHLASSLTVPLPQKQEQEELSEVLDRPQLLSWGATLSWAPGWVLAPNPPLSANSYLGNNTLCLPHLPLQDRPSSHPPSQDWFSIGGGDAPRGNLTVLLHVPCCMGVQPPVVIQPQNPQCFAERPHVCCFQLHPQPSSKLTLSRSPPPLEQQSALSAHGV